MFGLFRSKPVKTLSPMEVRELVPAGEAPLVTFVSHPNGPPGTYLGRFTRRCSN
jgi:hypothetical protein